MLFNKKYSNKKGSNKEMEKYNVLVVEDEKEIAEAIEIYLKNQGYNVFKGSNGL